MDIVVVLIGIVMFVALIGMFICSKKQRTNPNAQPLAIGLLIVVIVCGVAMMYRTGVFGGENDVDAIRENETKFACAKATVLGNFLNKKFPGQKILVVAQNPENDVRLQKEINALKDASQAEIVIDSIQVKDNQDMPVEDLMTAADFDSVLSRHTDCNLVVSLIGVPRNFTQMRAFRSGTPKIAILRGNLIEVGPAFQKGVMAAAVSYKPDVKLSDEAAPSDANEAFNLRYVLITPENVGTVGKDLHITK